eukprot:TRINITY_DN6367_c0_g1_i1.p1 TRINITY_DN6367_c0_g1~~TRINITY_DN6367_c0_g1_i1.p1  ORF type:complete len:105 (-),score=23.28 TRINITY_DN6367_c0_g1_i1:171-485(-)
MKGRTVGKHLRSGLEVESVNKKRKLSPPSPKSESMDDSEDGLKPVDPVLGEKRKSCGSSQTSAKKIKITHSGRTKDMVSRIDELLNECNDFERNETQELSHGQK